MLLHCPPLSVYSRIIVCCSVECGTPFIAAADREKYAKLNDFFPLFDIIITSHSSELIYLKL